MLLASAVAVHAADEATERRLGIRAVANGDYSNAVNFFKSALALSGEDQEKWAANAVDLAAAKLRTGDLAGPGSCWRNSAVVFLPVPPACFPARS